VVPVSALLSIGEEFPPKEVRSAVVPRAVEGDALATKVMFDGLLMNQNGLYEVDHLPAVLLSSSDAGRNDGELA